MRHYVLPGPAVLYAVLLVPGVIYSAVRMIHMPLLSRLSAHLSGPLALAVCITFFMNCRLTGQELNRVLLALMLPISSVCAIAAHGTFSRNVSFGSQSLHAAAGDFGPNQVASVLGLAALVLMLYLVRTPTGLWRKLLLAGVTIACLGQSALTLSRGGLYASIGAFVPAMFFLIGDSKSRTRTLASVAVAVSLGVMIIYPLLDGYTEGAITRRFSDRGMSGREALVNADIEVWLEHPIFGVGIGRSQLFHSHFLMTHNEFTRCLSEHGLFGVAAIITLALIALKRMVACRTMEERALAAALITWSGLFLLVNGMRLAAPSFTFGLALLSIQPNDENVS
jgi:O-antigen ligase